MNYKFLCFHVRLVQDWVVEHESENRYSLFYTILLIHNPMPVCSAKSCRAFMLSASARSGPYYLSRTKCLRWYFLCARTLIIGTFHICNCCCTIFTRRPVRRTTQALDGAPATASIPHSRGLRSRRVNLAVSPVSDLVLALPVDSCAHAAVGSSIHACKIVAITRIASIVEDRLFVAAR